MTWRSFLLTGRNVPLVRDSPLGGAPAQLMRRLHVGGRKGEFGCAGYFLKTGELLCAPPCCAQTSVRLTLREEFVPIAIAILHRVNSDAIPMTRKELAEDLPC